MIAIASSGGHNDPMRSVLQYLLNPVLSASVGFVVGKFLLPFGMYSPLVMKPLVKWAERKSARGGMPAELHVMRAVRDVDHVGAGTFASLAIWGLSALRHEELTAGVRLLGYVFVALLSSRKGVMNLGLKRNFVIASVAYWVVWAAVSLLQ